MIANMEIESLHGNLITSKYTHAFHKDIHVKIISP